AFNVEFGDPVALRISSTAHYTLDDDDEWSRIIPPGPKGHLVYIRDSADPLKIRPYTVTLFHQLKCLDILRRQFNLLIKESASQMRPLARHCMSYLRQIILCRPNIWLESTRGSRATGSRAYDIVCQDWTRVYEEAEANRKAYNDHLLKDASGDRKY
ncbi:hypothetical protein SCHPADRAFT_822981, partial [Schizopora paradoxa]